MRTITESESTPKADGFFMPAEFAPQDRVWMGWPHRTDTWAHGAKPAQKQYAAIARAIAEFTPVTMCANQVDYANCKAVFEEDENVTVIEMTTDDAWFRDTAATYVINGKGEKRANHWHFNAYGGGELPDQWRTFNEGLSNKAVRVPTMIAATSERSLCTKREVSGEDKTVTGSDTSVRKRSINPSSLCAHFKII